MIIATFAKVLFRCFSLIGLYGLLAGCLFNVFDQWSEYLCIFTVSIGGSCDDYSVACGLLLVFDHGFELALGLGAAILDEAKLVLGVVRFLVDLRHLSSCFVECSFFVFVDADFCVGLEHEVNSRAHLDLVVELKVRNLEKASTRRGICIKHAHCNDLVLARIDYWLVSF